VKFKVGFNFKDSLIIEAEDEDKAIEVFILKYEDTIDNNNETIENRVWESVKAEKL